MSSNDQFVDEHVEPCARDARPRPRIAVLSTSILCVPKVLFLKVLQSESIRQESSLLYLEGFII